MQLYNSLTRTLEHFQPQNASDVTLYTCGPTVYDYPHIGNLATYVRWDTLVRALIAHKYAVSWVMNITDVGHLVSDADDGEDKLQKGARREGKTAWEIADFYTQDFVHSLHALNITMPTHLPRATAHIDVQIQLIKRLEEKGYTYAIDDGVYFDTARFTDYGKLAGQKLEDLKAGARVQFNSQKRNSTDFALWKFSPHGEQRDMEWESPWGKGFPGWHIECSAMGMAYLGETLDIHAGGIDHLPIHHTNEIAQSEGATGKPFAKFWLHSNHIMVNGAKIAKSQGNGVILQDLIDEGFSALDVRMLFLQSHYRTQSNFSHDGLAAARNRRKNLQAFADLRFQLNEAGQVDDLSLRSIREDVIVALSIDLDTPQALAALSDVLTTAETGLINIAAREAFGDLLTTLDQLFGLNLLDSQDINASQKNLITQRQIARQNKDFAAADDYRNQLLTQGICVRDTVLGPVWSRV